MKPALIVWYYHIICFRKFAVYCKKKTTLLYFYKYLITDIISGAQKFIFFTFGNHSYSTCEFVIVVVRVLHSLRTRVFVIAVQYYSRIVLYSSSPRLLCEGSISRLTVGDY